MSSQFKTEIRFLIDCEFLEKLEEKLAEPKATNIVKAALTLLDWATDELQQERVILSAKSEGQDVHRLVMPEFKNIKKAMNG